MGIVDNVLSPFGHYHHTAVVFHELVMAVMRATGQCELHVTARVRSQARSAGNSCGSVSKLVGVRDCKHLRENGVLTRFVMAVEVKNGCQARA